MRMYFGASGNSTGMVGTPTIIQYREEQQSGTAEQAGAEAAGTAGAAASAGAASPARHRVADDAQAGAGAARVQGLWEARRQGGYYHGWRQRHRARGGDC